MVDDTTMVWVESDRWLTHRHRWVVALMSVSATAAVGAALAESLGAVEQGLLLALVGVTAATGLPAVALLPRTEWSAWSPLTKGAAVGRDRLVLDGLVYDFDTLDPAVAHDGTRFARPGRHHVLVPMRRDWSLDVRTHDPEAFTQALRASYREWAAARDARA